IENKQTESSLKNSNTTRYTNLTTSKFNHTNEDEPVFESMVRRKTMRYYIGNIGQKSNRAGLINFLNNYGIEPVGVRVIETYRGHLSAKITVYASDKDTLESEIIWPKKMYCRRWYGSKQWNERLDNDNHYDENCNYEYDASSVD
ncbi:MAG: hypothetical protein JAY75_23540, partial [Candidatus Thiodiazotropha taylori]|nr:hypothetical protein [Candidatus Thiodiazotropha taylori]MCW4311180.1 hypothetical protein [Candidatus Thiodiazotropha endolucinida]